MANGVAMAAVFFMVRIAVMPVYYSRMYAVYGTEAFYLVPWGGRVAWICSSICLDIMNVMWMHKIARGCYKVLRSARRSKTAAPQENGKTDWGNKSGSGVKNIFKYCHCNVSSNLDLYKSGCYYGSKPTCRTARSARSARSNVMRKTFLNFCFFWEDGRSLQCTDGPVCWSSLSHDKTLKQYFVCMTSCFIFMNNLQRQKKSVHLGAKELPV